MAWGCIGNSTFELELAFLVSMALFASRAVRKPCFEAGRG